METSNGELMTIRLAVKGLDCPDCAASLEEAVRGLAGVHAAHLVYATSRLTVSAETEGVVPAVAALAASMGY